MTTLWFVTPAWKRYDIVALCLEQRSRVIAELAKHGIEAHQVVIANDENLDIARGLGASVVERNNQMVGRKFNDGMEYAGKHGADWIVPIGSDSWIDHRYFLGLPEPPIVRTSPVYAAVTRRAMAQLNVAPEVMPHTAGPHVFHRSLLEPVGWRSCLEASTQTDTDTIDGIEAMSGPLQWEIKTLHPFQYVGFRVPPMMTNYWGLWRRWGVQEHKPWQTLRRYWPADLVNRAERIMSNYPPELPLTMGKHLKRKMLRDVWTWSNVAVKP